MFSRSPVYPASDITEKLGGGLDLVEDVTEVRSSSRNPFGSAFTRATMSGSSRSMYDARGTDAGEASFSRPGAAP